MSTAAEQATALNTSELLQLIDAQFEEVTPTHVSGTVAADARHHQPWGLIHGGLYTATVETFATIGAFQAVRDRGQQVVGVSNATDFLRAHRTGRLRVVGEAIHQGRTYQLWQVVISRDEDDKPVARGQVRLQNLDQKPPE